VNHLQLSYARQQAPACPYLFTLPQDVLLEKIDRCAVRQYD
jgi:hypothetical protein